MRLMACLLALAALVVAGCGGSDNSGGSSSSGGSGSSSGSSSGGGSSSSSSSSSSGGGQTVPVEASATQLKFTTKKLKAKAGTVTFKFKNPASIPHGVAIEGHGVDKDSQIVTKGSTTLTVKLKPGRYEFYCPVGNHKAAGMEGTLIVS
jgi:plastocyanin